MVNRLRTIYAVFSTAGAIGRSRPHPVPGSRPAQRAWLGPPQPDSSLRPSPKHPTNKNLPFYNTPDEILPAALASPIWRS